MAITNLNEIDKRSKPKQIDVSPSQQNLSRLAQEIPQALVPGHTQQNETNPSFGVTRPDNRISLADVSKTPDLVTPGKDFVGRMNDLYDTITAAKHGVETPEQKAAREKREAIKLGYGSLIDGISSLANLFYTTKWAPNQKTQGITPKLIQDLKQDRMRRDTNLQRFRDYIRQKAEKGEDRAWQVEFWEKKNRAQQERQKEKLANDYDIASRKLEVQIAKNASDAEISKAKLELEKAAQKVKEAQGWARIGETNRHNLEIEKNHVDKNGNKKKYPSVRLKGTNYPGQSQSFDLNKDSDVGRMYNLMEQVYGLGGLNGIERPKTIEEMRDFIIGYIGKTGKGTIPTNKKGLGWGNKSNGNEIDW